MMSTVQHARDLCPSVMKESPQPERWLPSSDSESEVQNVVKESPVHLPAQQQVRRIHPRESFGARKSGEEGNHCQVAQVQGLRHVRHQCPCLHHSTGVELHWIETGLSCSLSHIICRAHAPAATKSCSGATLQTATTGGEAELDEKH
eukprot:581530-Amphidinium_carterae.1